MSEDPTAVSDFRKPRVLGRSGLLAGRLGLGSSYGAPASAYELAFERGCNYFYWGTWRRDGMARAIRNLAPRHRDKMLVVLQSYSRLGWMVRPSVRLALKQLGVGHADVLLLGWHNKMPADRVMRTALALRDQGLVRKLAISCHHRPLFETFIKDPRFDIIMTRYNAAHRGAEREVFPHLRSVVERPGLVTYTTTRWGYLVDPAYTPQGMKTPSAADCYRFSLSHPDVDVALCGPSNRGQMEEDLKALELGPLSPEEMTWMKAVGDHVHRLTAKKVLANPFMQRKQ